MRLLRNCILKWVSLYIWLTLRQNRTLSRLCYNTQVGEGYTNIKAINKVTRLGMLERNTII